ncbi:class I SAM-dependent methyltransferase [Streptomyces sp. 8N114]|uniref:class I SAM-dependent methyltransferase n=1 Tax=Streptomyces sp. 8N114 TaxID=3457419 RepID=UPI003FCF5F00
MAHKRRRTPNNTFAHRSDLASLVRVFEVDHPTTQQDKRDRLAAADVPVPDNLTYVPLDFERETLTSGLRACGFDPSQPSVVTWLGVSMYLTADAIARRSRHDRDLRPRHTARHGLHAPQRTARRRRAAIRRRCRVLRR